PGRAGGMNYDDAFFAMEEDRLGHGASPVSAIPGVNLDPHAEAVKVNLVASLHGDSGWNLRSAVVVARPGQNRQATRDEQSQRTGGNFVCGKRGQGQVAQAAKC